MIGIAIAAPLVAALLTLAFREARQRQFARVTSAALAALLTLAMAGRVDALSLLFALLVSTLAFLATTFSAGSFTLDWGTTGEVWSRKPIYFLLLATFWSAMLLVVLADNFALLWLGITTTTLATTFLVGFSGEAAALEAAWKYLVLCSVGIALALLGIVTLAHVSIAAGLPPAQALAWTSIVAHAPATAPPLARLATALMLIGFATKAGLVPMHAWLPDAHSKAPPPISALLSGVLVSCALYAIMRTITVAAALGAGPAIQTMLLVLGALSTVIAGMMMLNQSDLKRLLAYSTLEHAGIVALALGFGGPIGRFAALVHVVGHAFAKSSAFFAAGLVQRERQTVALGALHHLWSTGAGGRILLGAVTALCGMPPFGLFVSELLLVAAGIASGQWIPLAFGLIGITLAFLALVRTTIEVEGGKPAAGAARPPSSSRLSVAAAGLALAGAAVTIVVPWTELGTMLNATAAMIARLP
jgi:hydrogenase-4 component F